jgi:hypothetical protein
MVVESQQLTRPNQPEPESKKRVGKWEDSAAPLRLKAPKTASKATAAAAAAGSSDGGAGGGAGGASKGGAKGKASGGGFGNFSSW